MREASDKIVNPKIPGLKDSAVPCSSTSARVVISDPSLTRLPRIQAEGNIPHIALMTGSADALECLLRRIGIAESEFTSDSGAGRVHLYYGGDLSGPDGEGAGANQFASGEAFSSAATLWSDPANRCGLRVDRAPRQRSTTICVDEPAGFVREVLWPPFNSMALIAAR